MSYKESALFFFRELAVEHTNCGKVVYSRVGRICQHDAGSRKHKDRFTTFLKARLNCSVPGEFPFYFDYIRKLNNKKIKDQGNISTIGLYLTRDEVLGLIDWTLEFPSLMHDIWLKLKRQLQCHVSPLKFKSLGLECFFLLAEITMVVLFLSHFQWYPSLRICSLTMGVRLYQKGEPIYNNGPRNGSGLQSFFDTYFFFKL